MRLYTQNQLRATAKQKSARQFYWAPPTKATITRFLQYQSDQAFSYEGVGSTATTPPPGYRVDHNRLQLGYGAAVYQQACTALAQWEMFKVGWVQLCWPTALTVGATVGILAQALGSHILNACRIVYTVDEETAAGQRFGFAYGTLPGHVEQGEERFLVEWRRQDDTVWYDILAFSRPKHWLVRLGYPVTRYFQKCFAQDSKAAMWQATHG